MREQACKDALDRGKEFIEQMPGEAGLTPRGVDRLCAILFCCAKDTKPESYHYFESPWGRAQAKAMSKETLV